MVRMAVSLPLALEDTAQIPLCLKQLISDQSYFLGFTREHHEHTIMQDLRVSYSPKNGTI